MYSLHQQSTNVSLINIYQEDHEPWLLLDKTRGLCDSCHIIVTFQTWLANWRQVGFYTCWNKSSASLTLFEDKPFSESDNMTRRLVNVHCVVSSVFSPQKHMQWNLIINKTKQMFSLYSTIYWLFDTCL